MHNKSDGYETSSIHEYNKNCIFNIDERVVKLSRVIKRERERREREKEWGKTTNN